MLNTPIEYICKRLKKDGRKVKVRLEYDPLNGIEHPRKAIVENRGSFFRPQRHSIVIEKPWNPMHLIYAGGDIILSDALQSAVTAYPGLRIQANAGLELR